LENDGKDNKRRFNLIKLYLLQSYFIGNKAGIAGGAITIKDEKFKKPYTLYIV
jgi:hypothetical protein